MNVGIKQHVDVKNSRQCGIATKFVVGGTKLLYIPAWPFDITFRAKLESVAHRASDQPTLYNPLQESAK
jgi:hypothetical protein